jgi:hypothetical protein
MVDLKDYIILEAILTSCYALILFFNIHTLAFTTILDTLLVLYLALAILFTLCFLILALRNL